MKFTTVLLASVALVGSVSAQIITSVLPFEDGDTVIVTPTTNALGATTFRTLSTVTAVGTLLTTPLVPTTTPLATSTTALTTPLVPTTSTTTPLLSTTTSSRTSTRALATSTTRAAVSTTTARTPTTTAAGVQPTTTAEDTGPTGAVYTTNVRGISATFQSGTQLAYSEWSAMVEPSLSAAYYATAKSSASTRVSSFLPSALVSSSLALAAVGGLVGVAQVML